ncbi:MAG: asparagine synthase (glutamine-hydrolyzing) [Lachnospiraceae bacterium]|nr:asparagine synthase (glutamine-hydrolyzing) [Lachnospiraceae bacterium]
MCGIAGLLRYGKAAARDIEVMKERMVHRGPDGDGTWCAPEDDVYLGHRRLAVIDLTETGAQPMLSHSERFVLSFNGEIYNHPLLKEKLAAKGITSFRGTSDTEVLLESLEHLGVPETLRLAKGMFAFALYDREGKTLTLARDRVGEKPLYYGYVGKGFVFASDIGCIRALSAFDNPVNEKVLPLYFAHGYIPAPYTIYRDIHKLKAGCVLTIRTPYAKGTEELRPYWSMKECALAGRANPFRGSFQEASAELERLVKESLKGQTVADVPVGAFLSGGIDSATTVALMQDLSPGKIRSFTIGMEEETYNEAVYAKEIAAHLGTEHTELYITEKDAQAVIPLLPEMFTEPFADSSQIPTYLVSKMTREHVTVSISGDAGDELFGGYNVYGSVEQSWKRAAGIPRPLRRLSAALIQGTPLKRIGRMEEVGSLVAAGTPEEMYASVPYKDGLKNRIPLCREMLPYAASPEVAGADVLGDPVKDMMLIDLCLYHPDDILVKVDRCAMAVSLETRVPFLDRDVVEFAWTLPRAYLRKDNRGKLVLRDVLYRHVPREMMERPKKGFSIPVKKWLAEGELRDWAQTLLAPEKIRREGFLNAGVVTEIWKQYTEKGKWREAIWCLLMFEAWLEGSTNGRLS